MFVGNADPARVPELAHLDLGRLKQVGKDGDSSAQQREGLRRYAESARLIVCQQGFEERAHGHPESRSIRTGYQYRLPLKKSSNPIWSVNTSCAMRHRCGRHRVLSAALTSLDLSPLKGFLDCFRIIVTFAALELRA